MSHAARKQPSAKEQASVGWGTLAAILTASVGVYFASEAWIASQFATAIAVFAAIVLLWVTEALPLPVTGFLVPVLCIVTGLLDPIDAYRQFGNDIIFLFIGCFILTSALDKHGTAKRLTFFLLSRSFMHGSLLKLALLVSALSYLLSMWISNTATTAIMVAITIGIIKNIKTSLAADGGNDANLSLRLLLTCAFSASIGGLATPIGSPPNLIAVQLLAEEGIKVSFLQWMGFGLPISLIVLLLLNLYLEFRLPFRKMELGSLRQHFKSQLSSMGKLSKLELQTIAAFSVTILLWILPDIMRAAWPTTPALEFLTNRLSLGTSALIGAGLLFVPLSRGENGSRLSWDDAKDIDWGTILLFGGGLTLGYMLQSTGLAQYLGQYVMEFSDNRYLFLLLVLIVMLLLTEFASNTAAAAIMLPIIIGGAGALETVSGAVAGDQLGTLIIMISLTASLGFMLPVSTPPNAIIYGTGLVSARDLLRYGLALDVIGITVIFACALFFTGLITPDGGVYGKY